MCLIRTTINNREFIIETDNIRWKAWLKVRVDMGDYRAEEIIESVEFSNMLTSKFDENDAIRYLREVAKSN